MSIFRRLMLALRGLLQDSYLAVKPNHFFVVVGPLSILNYALCWPHLAMGRLGTKKIRILLLPF